MKKHWKIITGLAAVFIALTCYAASTNPVTGLGEGTGWNSFVDQISKSTTKKDTFLAGLGGVRHTQVSITAAELNGMYAAPKALIAAPGTGKSIAIVKAIFKITRTATAFANGGAAIIQYDSTVNGGGTQACDSTLASTVITGAAGTSHSIRNGAVISDSTATIVNKGIYLSNATGAFDTGTGTATIDIWYSVVP
jgi:hypothetical protein